MLRNASRATAENGGVKEGDRREQGNGWRGPQRSEDTGRCPALDAESRERRLQGEPPATPAGEQAV